MTVIVTLIMSYRIEKNSLTSRAIKSSSKENQNLLTFEEYRHLLVRLEWSGSATARLQWPWRRTPIPTAANVAAMRRLRTTSVSEHVEGMPLAAPATPSAATASSLLFLSPQEGFGAGLPPLCAPVLFFCFAPSSPFCVSPRPGQRCPNVPAAVPAPPEGAPPPPQNV